MIWLNSAAILKIVFPFQSTLISISPHSRLQGNNTRRREYLNSVSEGSLEYADCFRLGRSSVTYLSIYNFPVWVLGATLQLEELK